MDEIYLVLFDYMGKEILHEQIHTGLNTGDIVWHREEKYEVRSRQYFLSEKELYINAYYRSL